MTIISSYGPPFDTDEWREQKEEIKKLLEEPLNWTEAYKYYLAARDLYAALEAEESDNDMYATSLSIIYDEASGGRISKPNTNVEEVIAILYDRMDEKFNDGYDAGYQVGEISP